MSEQAKLVWRAKWMGRLSLVQAAASTIAAAALAIECTHPASTAFWAGAAMLSLRRVSGPLALAWPAAGPLVRCHQRLPFHCHTDERQE